MKTLTRFMLMFITVFALSAMTVSAQTAQERSRDDDDERPEEGNISGGHIDIELTTLSPAILQVDENSNNDINEQEGGEIDNISLKDGAVTEINVNTFPNPATTTLYVDFGVELQARVSLHTILGQEVYAADVQTTRHEIQVGNMKQGVYFLNIVYGDKRVSRKVKLLP